jgi:hypothetical protein
MRFFIFFSLLSSLRTPHPLKLRLARIPSLPYTKPTPIQDRVAVTEIEAGLAFDASGKAHVGCRPRII